MPCPKQPNVLLRQELERMTGVPDVAQHQALLDVVTRKYPNSIQIKDSAHPIDRYTCLMYALDFVEKPEYIDIASYGLGHVFAGADFAMWLINSERLSPVYPPYVQTGDLVFYFDKGRFKHVGLWDSNERVRSKWGLGHLYEHVLFEAPVSYGNEKKFYAGLSFDLAFNHFVAFAEAQGLQFEQPES